MKSIAIWYSLNEGKEKIENIELHFNLWKVPTNTNSYKRFIDIGIKVDRTDCIKELKIYLPVKIEKSSVSNIVDNFINDNRLVCAIFNENYKTKTNPNSKTYQILNQGDELQFEIYNLANTDITLKKEYEGTIIAITPPHTKNKTYFRIRIDDGYCESIISIQKPSNSFIQSAFSKIELTDFRINEVRDLNYSLLEMINRECQFHISKTHFFYMVSSSEEIVNYHAPFINCRNLEKDKWKEYVNLDNIKWEDTILAYQWKIKDTHSLSILIKSKFESNNWITILVYVLVISILSIIFNVISSYIFNYFQK